jgi:hypothetical protein
MSHLSPAQYETSKHNYPTKIDNKGRTMETSLIQIQTEASQLLITYQTKVLGTWFLNLHLDEYIDNKKAQSWKFESKTHEEQLEDRKPRKNSRRSPGRRKHHKGSKWHKKRQTNQNGK